MRRLDGRRCGRVRFHTEQGSEYSVRVFRAACDRLDITPSMGRPGSAVDNAVIEVLALQPRVRAAARRELPDHNRGPPGVAAWIDDCNRDRRHSSIGMISPDRVRAQPRPGSRSMTRLGSRSVAPSSPVSRPQPSGWPPASLDTGCGRHHRSRPEQPVTWRVIGTWSVARWGRCRRPSGLSGRLITVVVTAMEARPLIAARRPCSADGRQDCGSGEP
jgi:hypothetical protein